MRKRIPSVLAIPSVMALFLVPLYATQIQNVDCGSPLVQGSQRLSVDVTDPDNNRVPEAGVDVGIPVGNVMGNGTTDANGAACFDITPTPISGTTIEGKAQTAFPKQMEGTNSVVEPDVSSPTLVIPIQMQVLP